MFPIQLDDKTLRDVFAAAALAGLTANPGCEIGEEENSLLAAMAYDVAEAMLYERKKRK